MTNEELSAVLGEYDRESRLYVRCYVMAHDAGCSRRWLWKTLGVGGATLRAMHEACPT